MKNLLLSILLSVSSVLASIACADYPFGNSVRLWQMNPLSYGLTGYQSFFYNAELIANTPVETFDYDENVYDWYHFFNKKVKLSAINELLYEGSYADINEKSSNQWIKYLYANNQLEVISYLKFAKSAEAFTTFHEDVWERNDQQFKVSQKQFIQQLVDEIKKTTDKKIQRRYAFLIGRLGYYSNQLGITASYHQQYFANSKKDFLYYWSLYFYCFTDKATSLDIAQVMRHAPAKRNAVYQHLFRAFNKEEGFQYSKSKQDSAAVVAFEIMPQLAPSLETLKELYRILPYNEQLDFLLLREISKIEDWVYTPFYSSLEPTAINYYSETEDRYSYMSKRVHQDRAYAKELLEFLQSCDLSKVKDKKLWTSAMIQLEFITQNYKKAATDAKKFYQANANHPAAIQLKQLYVLATVAQSPKGIRPLAKDLHATIAESASSKRFLFILARELELVENYPLAIALLSSINSDYTVYGDYYPTWGNKNTKNEGSKQYFWSYFEYLDYSYTSSNLKAIIDFTEKVKDNSFEGEYFQTLKKDLNYLKDLLGMKYIRENRLQDALSYYRTMDPTYWKNNYSNWERDLYDQGSYVFYANPFHQIDYTPDFILPIQSVKLTKPEVLEHLLMLMKRADDPKNKQRAKDYFQIATCFFNMSQYGNAWMMRRFSYSDYWYDEEDWNSKYEDEDEFRKNRLAANYYQKAFEHATNDRMKALSLRMVGYVTSIGSEDGYDFSLMRNAYPAYYKELSSCENLANYYK